MLSEGSSVKGSPEDKQASAPYIRGSAKISRRVTLARFTGYEDSLDNDDLEMCAYKNQIKIVKSSVLLYIGERATSVDVDLYLPSQVTLVIIQKFGESVPFCFATVGGREHCTVAPGSELKKNPHSK